MTTKTAITTTPTDPARSDTARSDTARSDTARSGTARSDTARSDLVDLVRRQHGVVACWQARELGASRSAYDTATRGGRDLARGVRLVANARLGRHARIAAAVLAGGPTAVATDEVALWLHGLGLRRPATTTVAIGASRRPPRRIAIEEATYLRTRTLERRDRTHARGIPTATIPRAVLDLAKHRNGHLLRGALLAAEQRRRLPYRDVLARALDARFSTGRPLLLRTLHDLDPAACDSILVARVRDRLAASGLEPDPVPWPVDVADRVLHPDATFGAHRVAIEADGFAFHSSPEALDIDHRKSNAYQVAGWTVLRVTWSRLEDDWPAFLSELLTFLR